MGEGKKWFPDDLVLADAHFKRLGESLAIAPNLTDVMRKTSLSVTECCERLAESASAVRYVTDLSSQAASVRSAISEVGRLMDVRSVVSQLCHEPLIPDHFSDSLALARSQCMMGLEPMHAQMRLAENLSEMRRRFIEFTEVKPLQPLELKLPDSWGMREEVTEERKPRERAGFLGWDGRPKK